MPFLFPLYMEGRQGNWHWTENQIPKKGLPGGIAEVGNVSQAAKIAGWTGRRTMIGSK